MQDQKTSETKIHKEKAVDSITNSVVSTKLPIPDEEKYVALMETNGEECESWYYFIKYKGNEKNLQHLQNQLSQVDWFILDDLSTFDLDLEHFVSEKTAKEMTKLELNSYAFHRKFDGKLEEINVKFRKKDNNEKKLEKFFDVLGYGQIEDFIDEEDIDEEDLTSNNESSTDDEDFSGGSETSSSESDKDNNTKDKQSAKPREKGIPKALLNSNLPRFAKAKRKQ